jgi:hypothetical protein
MKWYDPKADNPPWIKALADVRHMGPREGYCFHHVQAIMLSIDQYAESALGNLPKKNRAAGSIRRAGTTHEN